MAFCKEKQIRQFFEPSNTSNYLQALDQFNKKFGEAYTKEKKRLLGEKVDAFGKYSLGTADFVEICLRIWPFWSTPSDRRRAFKLVGVTQVGINSSGVDKSAFYMAPNSPSVVGEIHPNFTPTLSSPAGVAVDTLEYAQHKLAEAKKKITFLNDREVGPKESGIMAIVSAQPRKSSKRLTKSYGSAHMQHLHDQRIEAD